MHDTFVILVNYSFVKIKIKFPPFNVSVIRKLTDKEEAGVSAFVNEMKVLNY